jgi:hypothetical protein
MVMQEPANCNGKPLHDGRDHNMTHREACPGVALVTVVDTVKVDVVRVNWYLEESIPKVDLHHVCSSRQCIQHLS